MLMRSQISRRRVVAGLVLASLALPFVPTSARAINVPDAPSLGGTIRVVSDNDFALLAGTDTNVTRMILQNDAVWWDQQTAATTYRISLEANETYLYLIALGGGGQEDIGGYLNGVDITQIPSGPDGVQRAVGRAVIPSDSQFADTVTEGFLGIDKWFAGWSDAVGRGDVAYGPYNVVLSEVQDALTGATWGDPPTYTSRDQRWGPGTDVTGKSFFFPDSRAVVFRFKGTSLGSGFASAGDSSANVSWSAPGNDGGSPILDYTASAFRTSDNADTGRTCTTPDGSTRTCTVNGLTNGTAYYFKITARNAAGSSVPSDATASVTPNDFTPPALALAASNASSSTNNVSFTITGNEPITCSTLSSTAGTDLNVVGGTISSVSQTTASKCTVAVTANVSEGASGTVTVTKAASFSMTDTAGNAQTALSGSPATVTIAIPAPTTTTTSTTTTTTTTTVPAPAPAPASEPVLSLLSPSTTIGKQTTSTVAVAPKVATTTTVPVATTTTLPDFVTASAVPASEPVPVAPITDPGNVRATVDGLDTQVSVSRQNGAIVVSSTEFAFSATAVDENSSTVPLDSSGSLSVDKASNVNVRTLGLAPTSDVDAWMMSTPIALGRVTTDASGVVKGSFPVPARIEPGAHRVVLSGLTKSGKEVVVSIGVRVQDTSKTKVKWSYVFLAMLGIAAVFALVIPARRRREEEEQLA